MKLASGESCCFCHRRSHRISHRLPDLCTYNGGIAHWRCYDDAELAAEEEEDGAAT